MDTTFLEYGFSKCIYAFNRRTISDCFAKSSRTGIYILHFSNGEYYVGQAKDVVRRYAQHRMKHLDIEYISFKKTKIRELNEFEKHTLKILEDQKRILRNISLASILRGNTDLDEVVSPEDQEKWTQEQLGWESVETTRFEYPEQRRKYTGKFERLKTHPDYELICQILQEYIIYTTPYPRKTEYSFWAVSCLPSLGKGILARVNIYWQETLRLMNVTQREIMEGKENVSSQIDIAVFLSKSVLLRNHSEQYFTAKFKSLEFGKMVYPTGGQDQQEVFINAEEFFVFFDEPDAYEAIRTFNLRLMRKGACNNSRYHCFDLADEMLRTDNIVHGANGAE